MKLPKTTFALSASLICGNPLQIKKELKELQKGQIDFLHCDVMDGVFVPRFGIFPEYLEAINRTVDIPIIVHMMIKNPGTYIEEFRKAGADIISVHAETPHLFQTIQAIKKSGMQAGIVLEPATSPETLIYLLDDIDLITVMGINPGILHQKLIPWTYPKIADIKNMIADHPHIQIEIDGGVTPESAPKMINAGATVLVCGTGTIYQPPASLDTKIRSLRKTIQKELQRS